jgi:hypothetical protein
MSTGIFNPALVSPSANLSTEQKARASALLVANQVRGMSSVTELIRLAEYVMVGNVADNVPVEHRPDPWEMFGVHTTASNTTAAANFGDLDNEAGLRGELAEEDDGLG